MADDNDAILEPGKVWTCCNCGSKVKVTNRQGLMVYYVPVQLGEEELAQVYPSFLMQNEFKDDDNG
jgi:hypothetical protein